MKVEVEMKIKILDGVYKGMVDTSTTIGYTQTSYKEIGIIERLLLEWNHIFPYRSARVKREEGEQNDSD